MILSMLDKYEEGTGYIHRNQSESTVVPNAFTVASARRDERESRESRPGDETKYGIALKLTLLGFPPSNTMGIGCY